MVGIKQMTSESEDLIYNPFNEKIKNLHMIHYKTFE